MTSTTEAPVAATPVPAPSRSGARSAALLGVASLAAIVANYLFLLIAGRVLGSADYGALAALLGALTVVLLPTGAVQLAVSREVSRRVASGERADADAFSYATFRLSLLVTLPALAVAFLLVVPVRELLGIDSTAAVAVAAASVAAMFVLPVSLGVLQGYQRFGSVAILYVLPFALRLALFVPIALAGFRLGGAMYAAVFAGIVSAAFAVTLIEQPLRRGARVARPALRPFFVYLGPVVLGVIGIAVLTNVDIVVAKVRFADADAGAYAAASAFARVAFFLPATLLAVLFPRTAARHARGEDTDDILGRSLIVVAGLCGLLTLGYWMTGRGLVHTTFGPDFAPGGDVLAPFALAMTLYALANVLVGFHLSRGETRYAWILAAAVPVQLVVLALVPGGMNGLVWANVAIGRWRRRRPRALRRVERAGAPRRRATPPPQRSMVGRDGCARARSRSLEQQRLPAYSRGRSPAISDARSSGRSVRTRAGRSGGSGTSSRRAATTSSDRLTTSSAARRSGSRNRTH